MRSRKRLVSGAFLLTLTLGCLSAAGAASASASVANSQASQSRQATLAAFAAQARHAGLTSAQIRELQQEVNSYTARHGGTQVAINQVDFTGGNTVFVVPGQKYAHEVTTAGINTGPGEICRYNYFCTFASANFEGSEQSFYYCRDPLGNSYNGSWKNDQTPGVKATLTLYNTQVHKRTTYVTCAAYCNYAIWPSYDAIIDVDPC